MIHYINQPPVAHMAVLMPSFVADLHNHTPGSSDHYRRNETSPHDIVTSALDAGLDVFAATDHHSCWFAGKIIAAAEEIARETGRELLVIPGTELRITHEGDEAHIVALFDQDRYEYRFDALLGILGLTKAPVADEDCPSYTFDYDPVEVCRVVHALGGIACVAHADRWFGDYRLIDTELFGRLLAEPTVAAIDLIDSDASAPMLDGCDKRLISCSDSHCCEAIGSRSATLAMEDLSFWSLRKALTGDAAHVHQLV